MSSEHPTSASQPEDMLLDHAYDGIQEFDNPMPRWWVWIFWGSFWFSVAYLFHYSVGNGKSVAATYDEDAALAAAIRAKEALGQAATEQSLAELLADGATVESGKAVFVARCSPCHLEGQGSIGPNLTDKNWIHGKGTLMDIYSTVSEGVTEKGMPAWSRQLTPTELRQVVAFVGTLRGKDIPGKAPEGALVE
jgi:cytochrome c oxidase cbb3-type subunit III